MSKIKMLSISLLITTCFVLLAAVFLFISNEDGIKKIKEVKAQYEVQKVAAKTIEEPEETEEPYIQQGIRLLEDDEAIRDILLEKGSNLIVENGPISVKVTNVSLEILQPKSEKMQYKIEGMKKVTVVRLKVQSSNTSNTPVLFDLSTLTVKADTGEVSRIDGVFSTNMSSAYEANETKEGELVVLFESNANDIATIWLNVRAPFNNSGDNLGENQKLKIDLF